MLKKIVVFFSFMILLFMLFLPLFFAIDEVNAATDIQIAEFNLNSK